MCFAADTRPSTSESETLAIDRTTLLEVEEHLVGLGTYLYFMVPNIHYGVIDHVAYAMHSGVHRQDPISFFLVYFSKSTFLIPARVTILFISIAT